VTGGPSDHAQEFFVGQHLRPAELERARERGLLDCEREREGDVLDPDGLRGEVTVAEHRNNRRPAVQPGEGADGRVLRATDERRPEDGVRQTRRADQLFGVPLGPMIAGRPGLVPRADGAHVHEPFHTGTGRSLDDAASALDMHGLEGCAARLDDDPTRCTTALTPCVSVLSAAASARLPGTSSTPRLSRAAPGADRAPTRGPRVLDAPAWR